jgi:hypothetical protein
MERKADLKTVKAFWDLMSQHFPELYVDLSLFNTLFNSAGDSQLFKEAVGEKVPITQVYEKTLELMDEYYKGRDILWRPSLAYFGENPDALVSMLWVDDFNLENSLGLTPLFYVRTGSCLCKFQAYLKLKEPVPLKKADFFQRVLAKFAGGGGYGFYFEHRRIAGLANGRYADDPLVVLFGPFEKGFVDPKLEELTLVFWDSALRQDKERNMKKKLERFLPLLEELESLLPFLKRLKRDYEDY